MIDLPNPFPTPFQRGSKPYAKPLSSPLPTPVPPTPLIPPRVGSALRGRSPLQIRPTPWGARVGRRFEPLPANAAPMRIRLAEFEKIALARRIQRFIRVGSRLERGDP